MSRINIDHQSAVILHQFDYRNSSLIVHFFLSHFGKISAIAKGVKGHSGKSASKKSSMALFQPFQNLSVSLTGKHELLILKNIELNPQAAEANWQLRGKSLYCAYYINELLLRLLPAFTECEEIFSSYVQALDALVLCSSADTNNESYSAYETPLRIFELQLLEQLGYGLNLTDEVNSGAMVDTDKQYFYSMESGPSLIRKADIKQLAISGQSLVNLAEQQLHDQKTLQESKHLLKWAINEQLDNKPLKSRELFKQLYATGS
ncbi:MAG: DNA repair protein RecO [Thiotrichaceae bacterium]|nr:DNA repair protein RecO [Thiotrichaceae bacterium]